MSTVPGSRWYFGWNIVAAASFMTVLTVGMRMGVGPFFIPMMNDLNLSRSELSLVIAIGMIAYGLAMPAAGYLIARYSTRAVLTVGTLLVVLSCIWTPYASGYLEFTFVYGILLSIGLGMTSPVALTPVITRWFTRQRGMALFFLSTGSMAGIAVMTPVFTWMIETIGWQQTLLGFAALFALLNLPLSLLVMSDDAPEGTDTLPGENSAAAAAAAAAIVPLTFREALQTGSFWKVALGLFACGFSMNLLGTHGVPMLRDHGFDAFCSSTSIGLIGFVAIFSTLALGRIADRVERRRLLATIYLVRGLGFFALVSVGAEWELYLAAAVGGIVWAGSVAMSSAILADVYGVRLVGLLYGWTFVGHQIGAAISSWFGGWGYDTFGSHWPAFGSAGALLLIASFVAMRLPKPTRSPSLATA